LARRKTARPRDMELEKISLGRFILTILYYDRCNFSMTNFHPFSSWLSPVMEDGRVSFPSSCAAKGGYIVHTYQKDRYKLKLLTNSRIDLLISDKRNKHVLNEWINGPVDECLVITKSKIGLPRFCLSILKWLITLNWLHKILLDTVQCSITWVITLAKVKE
jgi:hypothetical protein